MLFNSLSLLNLKRVHNKYLLSTYSKMWLHSIENLDAHHSRSSWKLSKTFYTRFGKNIAASNGSNFGNEEFTFINLLTWVDPCCATSRSMTSLPISLAFIFKAPEFNWKATFFERRRFKEEDVNDFLYLRPHNTISNNVNVLTENMLLIKSINLRNECYSLSQFPMHVVLKWCAHSHLSFWYEIRMTYTRSIKNHKH